MNAAQANPRDEGDTAMADELDILYEIENRVRWLSSWTIHNANHIREKRDGLKVGGHQASCASLTTILTALYMKVLNENDRIAVKPHASPVMHAMEYLFGNQDLDKLKNFRAYQGAQSYPSRTKDGEIVDFSTGSVGLGAAVTNFAALTQDYLRMKNIWPEGQQPGRMVALVGDAELDEGNVYEALLDTWKHDIRNVWWVIDYNRQSLDGLVNEHLFRLIGRFFRAVGWNVVTLKYGKHLFEAFKKPGGKGLKTWVNDCPIDIYSALTFQGGAAWRKQIKDDMPDDAELHALIDSHDDAALHNLLTNLGGHCMDALLHGFNSIDNDKPTVFICYTIKGYGLPLMGHKDNHAGLLNPQQMADFRAANNIPEGREWERYAGSKLDPAMLQDALKNASFNRGRNRRKKADVIPVPDALSLPHAETSSTQEAFGKILNEIARSGEKLGERIVTTSPDVAVSTNLGPWINQLGLFSRDVEEDEFRARKLPSMQKWDRSPKGQHVELGIAENNLFLNLAALGLAHDLFGERLLPVGTLYDPFIARGLDALNYACYLDARFMVVATPSGITLAPEGGAHQSISTPMIGMGQPGLISMEPSYADELAVMMRWGLDYMQRPDGGAVYLRLSTRPLEQPDRKISESMKDDMINGGYWRHAPDDGAEIVIAYSGALAPEAEAAYEEIVKTHPKAGLMAITSLDRLYNEWQDLERLRLKGEDKSQMAHVENLLKPLKDNARIVTVIDGHPAALAWLGGVRGHAVAPLGVNSFGQSGDLIDLYNTYQIDKDAIVTAAKRFLKS